MRAAASKKPPAPAAPAESEAGVPPVDATPPAARKEPAAAKATAESSAVEGKRDVEIDAAPSAAPSKKSTPNAEVASKKKSAIPDAGQGMSTADILATARGGGAAPAKPAAKDAKKDAPPAPKEKTADAGSMSVADILATARGAGAAPAKPAAKDAKKDAPPAPKEKMADAGSMSVADILATARKPKSPSDSPPATEALKGGRTKEPEKPATSSKGPQSDAPTKSPSMSVADVLAAARGEKKQGSDRGAAANAGEVATPQPAEQPKAKAPKTWPKNQGLPADVPGIIAYCRKTDSKK